MCDCVARGVLEAHLFAKRGSRETSVMTSEVKSELLQSMEQPDPSIAGGLMAASLPAPPVPPTLFEDTQPSVATAGASQPLPEAQSSHACCKPQCVILRFDADTQPAEVPELVEIMRPKLFGDVNLCEFCAGVWSRTPSK